LDNEILVRSGQELVRMLDQTRVRPRAAIWVYNPDNEIWRLWIVCNREVKENEFYRIAAECISKNRREMLGIDISSIELVDENHPAIAGLKVFLRMEGLGSATITNNTFNGFYLPDGIVLRMAF
jgi:hypothetical protein